MPEPNAVDATSTFQPAQSALRHRHQLLQFLAPHDVRTASAAFAACGVFLGAGIAILGFFGGILVLLDPNAAGDASPPFLAVRWLLSAWIIGAFGLAGAAAFYLLRLASTFLAERVERDSDRTRQLQTSLDQAVELMERIARALEERAATADAAHEKKSQRTREDRIAELKAARDANDPARVLELYDALAGDLAPADKTALQSEVAPWFLNLIYRRLRTGRIQAEVVELAARFATSFAATAQGASVHAALPTLRRSAGLCPRCAQPYTGVANACPECLRPTTEVDDEIEVEDDISPSIEPILPE